MQQALADACQRSGRSLRWLEAYLSEVFDEAPFFQTSELELDSIEIVKTLNERDTKSKKDLHYPRLRISIEFILRTLALDTRLRALELREGLYWDSPMKASTDIFSALEGFLKASHEFTSPVVIADFSHLMRLKESCEKLIPHLQTKNLGSRCSQARKQAVANLRARLKMLVDEAAHKNKVDKSKGHLFDENVADFSDPREEWLKKI